MTLKDEYLRLYKRAFGGNVDRSALEKKNRELNVSLRRLIKAAKPSMIPDTKIYIGTLPINTINAQVRIADSGILLLVHDGLLPCAFGTGLLLGGLLPLSFQGKILEPDIKLTDARQTFREMVIAFLKRQRIVYNGSFVRPNLRQEFGYLVCTSIMWFVVAHELAHVLCDHLQRKKTKRTMIGTFSVESYVTSWQYEMEADQTAIRILRKLHGDNVAADTIYLGPLVLFELLESLSHTASELHLGKKSFISTHPPPKARRSAIIQDTYSPGKIPQTPFLDIVVHTMEQLRRQS